MASFPQRAGRLHARRLPQSCPQRSFVLRRDGRSERWVATDGGAVQTAAPGAEADRLGGDPFALEATLEETLAAVGRRSPARRELAVRARSRLAVLAGLWVCTATGLRTRGGPGRPLLGVLAWEDMTVRPLPGRVGPGVWRGSKALPSGGSSAWIPRVALVRKGPSSFWAPCHCFSLGYGGSRDQEGRSLRERDPSGSSAW